MRRILPILAALAFGLTALAYAAGAQRPTPHVGAFTLKQNVVIYWQDGRQEARRVIYRRASDGSFRMIETDGSKIFLDMGFAQGRGFFHVDYRRKMLWRDTAQKPDRRPEPADPANFERSEFYVGTDTVLGRTAYHMRVPGSREGSVDKDLWYLPETGGVYVKGVYYKPDGSLERTEEPYFLEFAEPAPALVKLPDFQEADEAATK